MTRLHLTARQREILLLVADGMTDKEIAKYLNLGIESVKEHVMLARMKLGARNRTAAVATAVRSGLIA